MKTQINKWLIVIATLVSLMFIVTGLEAGNPNHLPKIDECKAEVEALANTLQSEFDLVHQMLDLTANECGDVSDNLDGAIAQLDSIETKLDDLAQAGGLVPFTAHSSGGLCNSAAKNSSNPEIVIDSDGDDPFVVSSILVKTARQFSGEEGYLYFSINTVTIDQIGFDTLTGNLMAPSSGWAVDESADLMGTPIRRDSVAVDGPKGGNFPHQIVAEGEGPYDIVVRLFCRADDWDLSIARVQVSGWKPEADTIVVTYVPGT